MNIHPSIFSNDVYAQKLLPPNSITSSKKKKSKLSLEPLKIPQLQNMITNNKKKNNKLLLLLKIPPNTEFDIEFTSLIGYRLSFS